jgi:glycosyltransferase involved in cell wall biosynthesis
MLVSVLIPAFNARATIVTAVRSVLCQTFEDEIEVIVYDDGSTDGTSSAVEHEVLSDARVRLIRGAANSGVSRARNRLLAEARGEWIAFLDADDVFLPNKLAMCLSAALLHGCDLVTHDLGYLRADGKVIGQIRNVDFLQATVLRRTLAQGVLFSETLSVGEDSQFFGLLRRSAKPIHLSNVLTGLTIRSGSLTDKYWFQKRLIELWHETHKDSPPPPDLAGYMEFYHTLPWVTQLNALRKWFGQKSGRSAAAAVLSGRRLRAAPYLACSLVLNPGYILSRMRKLSP